MVAAMGLRLRKWSRSSLTVRMHRVGVGAFLLWELTSSPLRRYNNKLKSMGGTTSRESPPGGSESRGGVKPVTTKSSAAESEADKYDSTSTTVAGRLKLHS